MSPRPGATQCGTSEPTGTMVFPSWCVCALKTSAQNRYVTQSNACDGCDSCCPCGQTHWLGTWNFPSAIPGLSLILFIGVAVFGGPFLPPSGFREK